MAVQQADVTEAALPEAIERQLKGRGVRLVALTFVDNAGVTRVKAVPIDKLAATARRGVGGSYTFAGFAVNDHIASSPGYDTPAGDMRFMPDLAAVVELSNPPGWAWAPVDQHDQEGNVMPICQRSALTRAVEAAAARGIALKMTYEVEFTLLRDDATLAHEGPAYGARALFPVQEFSVALVDALGSEGIDVEQYHPEYSPGQYEISVAPRSPVRAADQYVLLRLTTVRVAQEHGYRVSFAPVVVPGAVGNGCHLHFSLWSGETNLMTGGDGPGELTDEASGFVAGVLNRLPESVAVYAPSTLSYSRIQPSHWSGAYTCWGHENREAALRLVKGRREARTRSANVELKTIDGTSNPYLAAAVLLSAGLEGLERGETLPPAVQVDPATLPDDERSRGGIKRLPADLGEAIQALERSAFVRESLGDDLFEAFLAVRRLEWETYAHADEAEVVEQHRWRYG